MSEEIKQYTINPLAWEESINDWREAFTAHVPGGSYTVYRCTEDCEPGNDWNEWHMEYCFSEYYDEGNERVESPEAGKLRAEQHWMARMLPALTEVTQHESNAKEIERLNEQIRKERISRSIDWMKILNEWQDKCDALQKRVAELELQLATASEDSARLDWLENHWHSFIHWASHSPNTGTLRSDIDAARKEGA